MSHEILRNIIYLFTKKNSIFVFEFWSFQTAVCKQIVTNIVHLNATTLYIF